MDEGNAFLLCPGEEARGERLDRWLALQFPQLTRTMVQKLMAEGCVTVEGRAAGKNDRIRPGEEVSVTIPQPKLLDALPQEMDLDIVYEDRDLLVVNKPKGMVVHPAPGNYEGTLVNGLLAHCQGELSGIGGCLRPGIVHRIDKNTSGLLVVAKSDAAHLGLAAQLKEHSFDRFYEAVVYGNLREEEGTVNAPLGRHPVDRKKMAVTAKNSKEAVTHYRVLRRFDGFTHVKLRLETGRTHQIRVHMAYIGHPLAGDPLYGPRKTLPGHGQFLHAKTLGFEQPSTGEWLEFSVQPPEIFQQTVADLRKKRVK